MLSPDAKLLLEWRENPILFILDVFDERPDEPQAEVLRALVDNNKVAVRSGHGVGKTWTAARSALWYFITHPYSKVITTAPTWAQVRKILWAELHSAVRKMPKALRNNLEILDTEIYMKDSDGKRIQEWFIIGRSSDKAENMQGFHAPYLMFIIDEASGISDEIYQAILGSQTTNTKLLLIGNPTKPEGLFYDAFHKNRELWANYHISCMTSPRVEQRWIEEMRKEWGDDSPVYKVRVLGEFPEAVSNALIPLHWVESAVNSNIQLDTSKTIHYRIGVDVAREGLDETVITVVGLQGDTAKVIEVVSANGKALTWTARKAKKLYEKYNAEVINVDDVGVGGGVTDILREERVRVSPIKFGSAPTTNEAKLLFENLKAQIYYELRDYFDPDKSKEIDIPNNSKLLRDLTALKIDYTSRDKIKIIKPDKSPDYSDSLALAITNINFIGGTRLPPKKYLKKKRG